MITSVVITSHNYDRYIERCVRSCLDQRGVDGTHEVIVVDDASEDRTLDVLAPFYGLPNLRIICQRPNQGVAAAANVGIRAARGRFVTRVDADDFVSEDYVDELCSFLEGREGALGVACDYELVDEHEQVIERRSAADDPIACGIMYRRDLLLNHGLYDPRFRHREEQELRLRLGPDYTVLHLGRALYSYRRHGANKSLSPEFATIERHLSRKDRLREVVE